MSRLILLLLAAVGLAACGTQSESDFVEPGANAAQPIKCSARDLGIVDERVYEGVLNEFVDIVEVASVTERRDIPSLISDMQRLRADFRNETWPDCMAEAKQLYLEYILQTIESYLARTRSGSTVDVGRFEAAASEAFTTANALRMERAGADD